MSDNSLEHKIDAILSDISLEELHQIIFNKLSFVSQHQFILKEVGKYKGSECAMCLCCCEICEHKECEYGPPVPYSGFEKCTKCQKYICDKCDETIHEFMNLLINRGMDTDFVCIKCRVTEDVSKIVNMMFYK